MTTESKPQYLIQILSGSLLSRDVQRTLYINPNPDRLETDPEMVAWLADRSHAVSHMLRLADRLLMEKYDPSRVSTIKLLHDITGKETPYDPYYITLNLLEVGWRDPRFSVQNSEVTLSSTVSVVYNDIGKLRCFRERYNQYEVLPGLPRHEPGRFRARILDDIDFP